jgi:hypothetical protein
MESGSALSDDQKLNYASRRRQLREEDPATNMEIEAERAQLPHARELPPEVANMIGCFVPIKGPSGSWGRNKVPDVADPAREAYPLAQIAGWAQWVSSNPKFVITRRVKVLFPITTNPNFTKLARHTVAFLGFPNPDGQGFTWE